ncbi:hypothetical protein MMC14_009461 [Varicellaria rhodocarpa]|nr:hypothetical protein [Varicellaria rhodocarpa]
MSYLTPNRNQRKVLTTSASWIITNSNSECPRKMTSVPLGKKAIQASRRTKLTHGDSSWQHQNPWHTSKMSMSPPQLIPHIDQIHTFRGPQGMQANPEPKIDPVRGCMGTSLLLWQELAQAVEDFFTLDHRRYPMVNPREASKQMTYNECKGSNKYSLFTLPTLHKPALAGKANCYDCQPKNLAQSEPVENSHVVVQRVQKQSAKMYKATAIVCGAVIFVVGANFWYSCLPGNVAIHHQRPWIPHFPPRPLGNSPDDFTTFHLGAVIFGASELAHQWQLSSTPNAVYPAQQQGMLQRPQSSPSSPPELGFSSVAPYRPGSPGGSRNGDNNSTTKKTHGKSCKLASLHAQKECLYKEISRLTPVDMVSK